MLGVQLENNQAKYNYAPSRDAPDALAYVHTSLVNVSPIIESINAGLEPQFVQLGQRLQDIYLCSDDLISRTLQASEVINQAIDQTAVEKVDHILNV